ncbi:actinia tenebrosa protease inhibitors-like [Dermacentor andersoni]|uniref:actinia tenebrosa protease inhibitors-like n=1 Tax=Dermacentor andersoni TaxID=34620 RepID=UPI002417BC72|nr:actinia tenebrosa protease inhibitors-like [Dermacentor andersoni]
MKTFVLLVLFGAALAAGDFDRQCAPSADPGPCKGYFPKWWYNVLSGKCEQFIYGGCQGNDNRYDTQQECEMTCDAGPTPKNDTCYLPMKVGPCFGYFPRYYYNATTNSCNQFIYGGCQGNANNFATLEKCRSACSTPTSFTCYLPKKTGPCLGYFPRYYYNTTTNSCDQFIYGGCRGNPNNFKTLEKCQSVCINGSYIEELTGSWLITKLVALADYIRSNPVLSRSLVRLNPVCNEPKQPGICAGYFPRFFFNNVTKTCEPFVYGGCQGNGNNFHTLEECNSTCWASLHHHPLVITSAIEVPFWPLSPPEECTYPADAGPCYHYNPRFFYSTLTKSCDLFLYGGCGGNANNFRTYDACQSKCTKFFGVIPRA